MTIDTLRIRTELDTDYDEALERVPRVLAEHGFGVLTEIDVKAVFKKKLDVDFRRYKILGACNPKFALRALSSDLDVGVMLPCSVVVYETEDGKVVVAAVDPMAMLGGHGDSELEALSSEVREQLRGAIEALDKKKQSV